MPKTTTRESKIWDRLWKSGDGISADYPLALLPKERLEGKRVLEIGCGTLRYSVASRVEDIDYTGFDISTAALRIAARDELPEVRSLVRGDARKLPFSDGSYDVVLGLEMLHTLGLGMFQAIGEMARVSRDEIIFTAQSAEEIFRSNGMEHMINEGWNVIGRVRGIDVIAVTEPELRKALQELGLEIRTMVSFSDEEIDQMCEPGGVQYRTPKTPKSRIYVEARKKADKQKATL